MSCDVTWCHDNHEGGYHSGRRWHWDGANVAVEIAAVSGICQSELGQSQPWVRLSMVDADSDREVDQTIGLEEIDELIVMLTRARRDVADTMKWAEESARFHATS